MKLGNLEERQKKSHALKEKLKQVCVVVFYIILLYKIIIPYYCGLTLINKLYYL